MFTKVSVENILFGKPVGCSHCSKDYFKLGWTGNLYICFSRPDIFQL